LRLVGADNCYLLGPRIGYLVNCLQVDYINPAELQKPRSYTQAISVTGPHRTIYVGGQDAVNEKGELVGKGSLKAQTEQVLSNIETALAAADAKLENLVKLTIYLVAGQNPTEGFIAFQQRWQNKPNPPVITVVFVSGLGNPDWLVEIDAVAVSP
jgi:enamine deaminase RidA (YjgF/YER057c/UK114 family)